MGVPSFFKWLARKYPKILVNAVEEYPETDKETGKLIYPDTSRPNPTGVEYDCLYLDMNGIIHPCTHPEGRPAPKNEDEMLIEIFHYVDRLFNIVRPRRLVYFAIDGVAPRAKMNQQRTRRFKSAKETRENNAITETIIREMKERGEYDEEPEAEKWDRNQITPGTPFMKKVADALRYYIIDKVTNDSGWKDIACILSDSNVPGEGEHKLMEYIRYQHSQDGYNANTRHCICGLDADLIMLGLATHEPHFSILREDVLIDKKIEINLNAERGEIYKHDPFQFLCLNVMREYLEIELRPQENTVFEFDLERAIDDFVFICFLVGNDFLPHIPTLEIRDEAISKLTKMYRDLLPKLDGYLTKNGEVYFSRVAPLFKIIGSQEDEVLIRKREKSISYSRRQRAKSLESQFFDRENIFGHGSKDDTQVDYRNVSLKDRLKSVIDKMDKQKLERFREKEFDEDFDPVRLGVPGWRERYYKIKFGVDISDKNFFQKLTDVYSEGMQWVMKYYYQGCESWDWYYPYHYPPFIQDVSDVSRKKIEFNEETEPFKPFDQLLAVLPSESSQFLPPAYADLMTDPNSPIVQYYPTHFEEDANGKPFSWQAIALLPFIDSKLLKKSIKGLESTFTEEETERNDLGQTYIFCSRRNPLSKSILSLDHYVEDRVTIDSTDTPFFGFLERAKFASFHSRYFPSPIISLPDLKEHECVFAVFHNPTLKTPHFESKLREGLIHPTPVLTLSEINKEKLYHSGAEQRGNYNNNGGGYQGSRNFNQQQNYGGGPVRGNYNNNNFNQQQNRPNNNFDNRQFSNQRGGPQQFNNNNFNNQRGGPQQFNNNFNNQRGGPQQFNNNNNFNNQRGGGSQQFNNNNNFNNQRGGPQQFNNNNNFNNQRGGSQQFNNNNNFNNQRGGPQQFNNNFNNQRGGPQQFNNNQSRERQGPPPQRQMYNSNDMQSIPNIRKSREQ